MIKPVLYVITSHFTIKQNKQYVYLSLNINLFVHIYMDITNLKNRSMH